MFFSLCILLTTLLLGCTKSGYWSEERIHSHSDAFAFCKVRQRASDQVYGLDIEFVRFVDGVKAYLLIHSTPIPCHLCPNEKTPLHIEIDKTYSFYAERLEGGQRFLLPQEATELLKHAFMEGKNALITLPGYHSLIDAQGFSKHFSKIEERPWMENPFYLPY
jgi:hypothetical protein